MKSLLLFLALITIPLGSIADDLEIEDFFNLTVTNGYELGAKHEKMYQFLMATDGYGRDINGISLEVYKYDLSVQSGKDAIRRIEKEGFMGTGVVVNQNLMLLKKETHPNWTDLKNLFLSL